MLPLFSCYGTNGITGVHTMIKSNLKSPLARWDSGIPPIVCSWSWHDSGIILFAVMCQASAEVASFPGPPIHAVLLGVVIALHGGFHGVLIRGSLLIW